MGIISAHKLAVFQKPFVVVNPTGDPRSKVWCVGEAPGRTEHDDQVDCNRGIDCKKGRCRGHVFAGDCGVTFDIWLEKAGLSRADLYVTNTVPVWPGADDPDAPKAGSKKPSHEMVAAYRPILRAQIEEYDPRYIIGLGAFAYREMLAGSKYASWPFDKLSGRPCEIDGRTVFSTMHPAAGLHNPFDSVQTWLGLRSAADYISGRKRIPAPVERRYRVLHGYAATKRVLQAIPPRKRRLGIGVDTEGYPGDWWSLQFEVAPGVAYLIYASDLAALRAFAKYAPRPFIFHNALHDLDPVEEMLTLALGRPFALDDGEFEDTMVGYYVCAREIAKGDANSDEVSVIGQSLKTVTPKYLFEEMIKFDEVVREPLARITNDYLFDIWARMLGPDRPQVANKYRDKPTAADVSVTRPSKWGNPFKIRKAGSKKGYTRLQAIREYKKWVVKQDDLLRDLPELVGKRLVCCCAPAPCHAEVLADLVAALPGPLHIPREGRAQLASTRIFNMLDQPDIATRWHKLKLERKKKSDKKEGLDWTPIIEKACGPTPRLHVKHVRGKAFTDYACCDADMTGRHAIILNKEMDRIGVWQPYWIDMSVIPMLRSMTKTGLRIDLDRLSEFNRDARKIHKEMHAQLVDYGKRYRMSHFSPDSNDDVAVLLYEKMDAPHSGRKTPSGHRLSVEEKVLSALPLEGEPFAFRKLLLDYKEVYTLLTRYIEPLPRDIWADGRVHPKWRNTITVSGRLACEKPNLLAFPARTALGRRVRNCFVPDEGDVYLSIDLSQIELRVLASLSRDPVMMRAFIEGRDMHADAAESAFGIKQAEVDAETWDLKRTQAKELNFGAAYGLTGGGYQLRLAMKGVELDKRACDRAIAAKREEWAVAFAYLASAGDELAESPDAIVRDMWDRVRYLPMIWSPVPRAQAEARRQAGNMRIQGGAQGVEKLGMKAWWDLRDEMPNWRPLLQIHDDVVFQGPADEVEEVSKRIQQIFSEAAQEYFCVPITAGIKYGESWGQMMDPAKRKKAA